MELEWLQRLGRKLKVTKNVLLKIRVTPPGKK